MRSKRLCALASVLLVVFVSTKQVHAKMENGFSFGPVFFSGAVNSYLTPMLGADITFFSAILWSRYVNLSNRFDLGMLLLGTRLGAETMLYNGVTGQYTPSLRVNFSKQSVVPFIEAGPVLGIFALFSTTASEANARSQTSLKYGYSIGTGFDSLRGGRASGGWGISVSYFDFLPTAENFEFSAGGAAAKGVKLDFRFLFGGGDGK